MSSTTSLPEPRRSGCDSETEVTRLLVFRLAPGTKLSAGALCPNRLYRRPSDRDNCVPERSFHVETRFPELAVPRVVPVPVPEVLLRSSWLDRTVCGRNS